MLLKQLENFATIIATIPSACAILSARGLSLESANLPMLQLWDRDSTAIGLPLLEFMPELANQAYPDILRQTIKLNTVHKETAARVDLLRSGEMESIFMDYTYTPIQVNRGKPTAILVTAVDVTQRERDRLLRVENLRNLHALIKTSPVGMCLFMGPDLIVDVVNDKMLELWRSKKHMGIKAMKYVYHHGIPFSTIVDEVTYAYTPVRDEFGNPKGIILITDTHYNGGTE